jgi:hypothetical protein
MKQLALSLLLTLVGLTLVNAGQSNKSTTPPPPDPVLVKSVDAAANTIAIGKSKDDPQTFTVNAFTRIVVDGKAAKLDAVQVGMRVSVSSSDNKTASRIDADTYVPKVAKKK